MNRLLFMRHQMAPDIVPQPGSDPFASLDVSPPPAPAIVPLPPTLIVSPEPAPPSTSRTPTVKLDPASAPASKSDLVRKPSAMESMPDTAPLKRRQAAADSSRYGNERRSSAAVRFFVLTLLIMFVCFGLFGAMIYSFYEGNILPRFPLVNSAAYVPPELADSPKVEALKGDLASAQAALLKANDSIMRLQREYDALSEKQQNAEGQMSRLVTEMKQALTATDKGRPVDAAASISAALQVASVVPVSSSSSQELWLLKERNRLTFYADRAIAQGSAEAMASLWLSFNDPELARLRDGIQAEIIRVQNYYLHLSRLPPDYRLPVRELFRDQAIRSEADLKPDQIIPLMLDQKQPLEVRIRCAYVLGGQRHRSVAQALVQAMKNDPALDVVKEAQRTLEEDYQMRVAPLNSRAAEDWWQEHGPALKE